MLFTNKSFYKNLENCETEFEQKNKINFHIKYK